MNELRNTAKQFCQHELYLDEKMISNEDFEEEDYHNLHIKNYEERKQYDIILDLDYVYRSLINCKVYL